jgi:sulfide:quinone oxidoreductase
MPKRALVVGGGFAGLEAAIQLQQAGLEVTLVSNRSFLTIYPTSIWVATGETAFENICLDLPDVARRHGFRFVQGEVEGLSGAKRSAIVSGAELTTDHLVIALGGEKLKPKGVEHTFGLGGDPHGVERLRDALAFLVARGEGRIALGFGGNPKDPSAVRGGPMFELVFNVDTMLRRLGVRERFTLTFFAPMTRPGERMGKNAFPALESMMGRLGIAMRLGKKITGFEPGAVAFEDGSRLESDLIVFLGAGNGHPVVNGSDLPRNEAGFIRVDAGCAVPGFPGVWAIGDAAALEGPDWRAKQGHLAEVMARVAAFNITAQEAGVSARRSYLPEIGVTCLLDTGGGAVYVHRDERKERMVPLPVVGHWLKKGWGAYYKLSKRKIVPRLPGM